MLGEVLLVGLAAMLAATVVGVIGFGAAGLLLSVKGWQSRRSRSARDKRAWPPALRFGLLRTIWGRVGRPGAHDRNRWTKRARVARLSDSSCSSGASSHG